MPFPVPARGIVKVVVPEVANIFSGGQERFAVKLRILLKTHIDQRE